MSDAPFMTFTSTVPKSKGCVHLGCYCDGYRDGYNDAHVDERPTDD